MAAKKPAVVIDAAAVEAAMETFAHPWNANSQVAGAALGRLAGLTGTGIGLVRIPPGRESFVPHAHHREDEWIYVLAGRGIARLGEREVEIGPGDFVGMPAPQEPHQTRNPFGEDLVYLVGGASMSHEVVDFPAHDRRMIRLDDEVEVVPLSAVRPMGGES